MGVFNILSTLLVLASTVTTAFSGTVLIYGPTSPSSQEENAVIAAGHTPVTVSASDWAGLTAADFAAARAVVFGDPWCSTSESVINGVPTTNNPLWGPLITGNVIVIGTDEVLHNKPAVTNAGIAFVTDTPGKTGLYVSLSCYFHGAAAYTPLPLLSTLGSGFFTVRGVPGCYNNAHIVAVHPALAGITDATLSGWGCSVHQAFDSYPADFVPLAIAASVSGAGSLSFADGSFGVPYIIARGEAVAPIKCGDGVLDATEECDDSNVVGGDGCNVQCKLEVCGNGILDAGESCDDGNTSNGDGCTHDCHIQPPCGDGVVDAGEQCDDENVDEQDGCDSECRLECGNGVLDAGEECDSSTDCDSSCHFACGNGILDAGEQCDDKNTYCGDGCDHACRLECGNGVVTCGESCDDGNFVDGDGCESDCTLTPTPAPTPAPTLRGDTCIPLYFRCLDEKVFQKCDGPIPGTDYGFWAAPISCPDSRVCLANDAADPCVVGVPSGSGNCAVDWDCQHGTCTTGVCSCSTGWCTDSAGICTSPATWDWSVSGYVCT